MDHQEAVAAFFTETPEGVTVPEPVAAAGAARALRDALEPVAMHAVWSTRVGNALAAHGHDFFTAYVTGRGAALGDVPGALVASTFAVFEPGFLAGAWDAGRKLLPLDELQELRDTETAAGLREALHGDETDVAETAAVLERAVDAVDGTGRPLFAALRSRPRLSDPFGRLWRAADLVREHRGDGHIAASVAAGLDPVRMGILSELWVGYPLGEYSGTRAWPQEASDAAVRRLTDDGLITGSGADTALTAAGRRFRDDVEARSDDTQTGLLEALGDDLGPVTERLAAWSARCVEAGAFPPDVRKRAAG
ncbi:hypothetical protein EV383_1610 [Pseudonocardia sediminis]|uniref:SalK n=1 Tax=Pseudonocardia sediminis TaxID=1397368 RepID=A0A4Q7USW3_PSEST|nr:hypothetical protein [Pseudonocardia sediminis]RZT84756.1 hypothetical protein EV383_1610 [Pseudonocardia sediminis]